MLLEHKDILLQLEKEERKLTVQDADIQLIFQYLKQLLHPPGNPEEELVLKRVNRSN